jgi:hypothetical protein
MAYTLFEATYRIAKRLGQLSEGKATGGTTTTLIDTARRDEIDDAWNDGTVWIIRDSAGAGAAPQGEWSEITDFAQSTNTVTLLETLTAAIAAGDRYAIAKKRYDLQELIEKANDTLGSLAIPSTDITSLTISSSTSEYDIPAAARRELKAVYVANRSNVNDSLWEAVPNWKQTGPTRLFVPKDYPSGRRIRLDYMAPHSALTEPTDTIDEQVHIDIVVWGAVAAALFERVQRRGTRDKSLLPQSQAARSAFARAKVDFPIRKLKRQRHTMGLTKSRTSDFGRRPATTLIG